MIRPEVEEAMRKLMHLLLIIGLVSWEMVLGAAMNDIGVHASMYAAPSSSDVGSLSMPSTVGLPQSTEDYHGAGGVSAVVALTFDDGPQPVFTPQILGVLQRYNVHATFFCIGSQVQEYPEIVRQLYQSGNVVGDHTWSHPDLTRLSPAEIRWQLSSTAAIIQQVTGVAPTLFRPPYDATNATVMSIGAQLGLTQTGWTIDTRDWQQPGVNTLVSMVLTQAHNGSIILMHDGGGDRAQTVQALPQIILGLQTRGFTFTLL
ncbi:MAG TPA: polysaccharide deacetylase family protein [Ktedonobacteraceae bacterium]